MNRIGKYVLLVVIQIYDAQMSDDIAQLVIHSRTLPLSMHWHTNSTIYEGTRRDLGKMLDLAIERYR